MKKVLILIHDMNIGGAQKSLLSFSQAMASCEESKEYEIHLMPIKPSGPFLAQLPDNIQLVAPPKALRWMGSSLSGELLKKHFSMKCLLAEILWILRSRLKLFPKKWNLQQRLWSNWRRFVPKLEGTYDAAISYMDGVPNYYVCEKVDAPKKTLWFHNEYQKLGYDAVYDKNYYGQSDTIVTISEKCRDCLIKEFPQDKDRIHILENITSAKTMACFSQMFYPEE